MQRCRGSGEGERSERWPGYDFNACLELCRCCGLVPLETGSRWSVWFCDECKGRVLELNAAVGTAVIPIGRHSIMNSLAVTVDTPRIERFADELSRLFGRMDTLEGAARERVAANRRALDFADGDDVRLQRYLAAGARARLDKRAAFDALARRFTGRA